MNRLKRFLFINSTTRQTVAKNTVWLFVSEALSRVLKMILVIYAARVLGTEGWGTFSYALSLGSLLMIFSDIGISGVITRETIQKKEGYKAFVATALALKWVLVIGSTLVVIVVGPLISHIAAARPLLPLIGITLCFDAVRDLLLYLNTAFEKMERDMLVKTILSVATIVFGIVLLTINTVPQSIALAYAIGSILGALVAYLLVAKDLTTIQGKRTRAMVTTVLYTTLPFAAISLINTVMVNTDIYLLGVWKNTHEIGLYSSAQRIYQLILMIPVVIATALFPLQSRLAGEQPERFAEVLAKATACMFAIGLPISIGGILYAPELIHLLFGAGFEHAAPLLAVLLVMLIAAFPLVLFSNALFAYNKQRVLAGIYVVGFITNAGLNIALIPTFGALGSAIATLVSTWSIYLLIWKKLRALTNFRIYPHIKRILLATLCMALAIIVFNTLLIPWGIGVILAIIIYTGTLWLFKEPLISEVIGMIKHRRAL